MIRSHPGQAADVDWDATVRAYDADVRAAVRAWMGFEADAVDDVVQETFAEAYNSRHTYDPLLPILPWLKQIARNKVKRRWRKERRVVSIALDTLEDAPGVVLHDVGSDDHVTQIVTREALGTAIGCLPQEQRRAFLRWELDRRSTDELAASEQVSASALRQRVKRAKSTVREEMLDFTRERPTWALVPALGTLGARLRARWARLAGAGWPDAVAACAVPVVAAGMAVVSSIWPLPSPTAPEIGPPPSDRAPTVATTDPAAAVPPVVAADRPEPRPADARVTAPPPPPAPPPAPLPKTTTTTVEQQDPGGSTDATLGGETHCDAGLVGALVCLVTPE